MFGQKGQVFRMSVTLKEVLAKAGYDIKNNVEDAKWLQSQQDEFEELRDEADLTVSNYDEYRDYVDLQEDLGNYNNPTWEEWRKENGDK